MTVSWRWLNLKWNQIQLICLIGRRLPPIECQHKAPALTAKFDENERRKQTIEPSSCFGERNAIRICIMEADLLILFYGFVTQAPLQVYVVRSTYSVHTKFIFETEQVDFRCTTTRYKSSSIEFGYYVDCRCSASRYARTASQQSNSILFSIFYWRSLWTFVIWHLAFSRKILRSAISKDPVFLFSSCKISATKESRK